MYSELESDLSSSILNFSLAISNPLKLMTIVVLSEISVSFSNLYFLFMCYCTLYIYYVFNSLF